MMKKGGGSKVDVFGGGFMVEASGTTWRFYDGFVERYKDMV